jgi:hypothetical protein
MDDFHVVVIDGNHLLLLLKELADNPPARLYVWLDDGGAKFKLDRSMWSPPLGHVDEATT